MKVSVSTMSRAVCKLGWAFRKSRWEPLSETKRGAWRERMKPLDPRKPVFVDQCSTNITLIGPYAMVPEGERAFGKAPRNWGKTVTLVVALSKEGATAAMSVDGPSMEPPSRPTWSTSWRRRPRNG